MDTTRAHGAGHAGGAAGQVGRSVFSAHSSCKVWGNERDARRRSGALAACFVAPVCCPVGNCRLTRVTARPGSIGYFSSLTASDPAHRVNVINKHDMGREIQLSFYAGPNPFNPPTPKYPQGACPPGLFGPKGSWTGPAVPKRKICAPTIRIRVCVRSRTRQILTPPGAPMSFQVALEPDRGRGRGREQGQGAVFQEDGYELPPRHAPDAVGVSQRVLRLHVRADRHTERRAGFRQMTHINRQANPSLLL